MLSHNEWKNSNDNNNNEWEKRNWNWKLFCGFHKQKELLDSDYESKTSIELYKNKDTSWQWLQPPLPGVFFGRFGLYLAM